VALHRSSRPRDRRGQRWEEHRATRRAQLIASVVAAVEERGAGVGMDDIAAASGIAKPIFYRYFDDKADLFLAVGRTVAEGVVSDTTAAIAAHTEPRAMLQAGIDGYVRSIERSPELYRFVAHNAVISRGLADELLSDYATVVGERASQIIGGFLRQGGVDDRVAEIWGFGIVGMVRAAVDRWLDQGRPVSRRALVRSLTDLVWPGLASAADPPAA
jgi:AcrR family transcriptional regulator